MIKLNKLIVGDKLLVKPDAYDNDLVQVSDYVTKDETVYEIQVLAIKKVKISYE